MPEAHEMTELNSDAAPAENPRAVLGGNNPPLGRMIAAESGDFAAVVTAFLEDEYQQYPEQLNALLDGAANLPEPITSQEDKEAVATVVKQIRDLNAKFEAFQKKEKQPYLRGGQAVDQFFFGMMDKLVRRNRASQPGAYDNLIARMTAYDNMLIEQERQRREAEAAARRAEAERARQAAEAERQRAAEAQRAAERARNEQRRAERQREAEEAAQRAAAATAAAEVTAGNAEAARIETLTPAAATVRSRGQDGTLSTTKTVKYAVVEDRNALNKEMLWPFLKQEHIEQALAAWAKTTDYNIQMPGASIGRRNQSVVR